MADIKFNTEFTERLMGPLGLFGYQSNYYHYFRSSRARFYIMKGTIPSQTEIESAGLNFRQNDILIEFDTSGKVYYDQESRVIIRNVSATSGNFTGPTQQATWWYWDMDPTDADTDQNGPMRLAGSVSDIGSGGEVEVADSNIVPNQKYRIGTIEFQLLKQYTYV